MKFTTGILLTMLLGGIAQSFLPWWTLLLTAVICGLIIPLSSFRNFTYGFLGGSFLWGGYAFFLDQGNNGILSGRMAELFGLSSGSLLIVTTLLLGGLVGGMGAMTGFLGRKVF